MHRQLLTIVVILVAASALAGENPDSPTLTQKRAGASYGHLPLAFEANEGQLRSEDSFSARGIGYRLLLASRQISLALSTQRSKQERHNDETIAMTIEGINPECRIHGLDELPGKANYFIGSDRAKWRVGVRTFGRVQYEDVYPGINLVFYGTGEELEYDLVVRPGADPRRIKFLISGESEVAIDENRALRFSTSEGVVRFRAPHIYQDIDGARKDIAGGFRLRNRDDGEKELAFAVESYDQNRALVIDPVLDYSTYLGGSANDWAGAVAVDNAGNAYVAGTTASIDFPVTPTAVFPTNGGCAFNCYDAFVAKINVTGGLEYSTYLGGSNDDFGTAIAIDASGNAYVAGMTGSTDFPTTGNALQRSCGGTCFNHDAFVTKLDATGSALSYSTYMGGPNEDAATGIAVKGSNAYVCGFSGSADFPVTPGAYQTTMQGQGSSFVVQLNADASAEVFGTFLGEVDLFDAGGSIALDGDGNSYVAGTTLSANFPVTAGAFHTPFVSGLTSNLAIVKLNPTGTALVYSALIGGTGAGGGIAVDGAGNAYVAATAGPLTPVTPGAIDQPCGAGISVLKLNAAGSDLLTAAHLCPDRLWPVGIAFDASQNVIFSGYTDSTDLPTTAGSLHPSKTNICCFADVILGKLNASGSALQYLTYFGSKGPNSPNGMAEDSAGNIFLAGWASSSFPIKNGFQTTNAGSMDGFLTEFTLPKVRLSVSPGVLNFPARGVGIASPTLQVVVANVSASSIAISGALATGDFALANNGCGSQLPAGAHCLIDVGFTPLSSGKRTGLLTITAGTGVQKVHLTGTGVSGPVVSFSSAYQINTASGVTSPPFPVTITNLGNQDLTITQISLTNGPGFNFSGLTNCFKPVIPLGSCTVNVTFTDYFFGSGYATLGLTDNASGGSQAFGLIGNVVDSGLVFTSPGLRFGQQVVGTRSTPQRLTLINGTGATVSISSIKAGGNFSQSHNCKATLAAGAYCNVSVTFKPTSVGIKQGSITVSDDASASPLVLPLLGTGD